MQQNVIVVVFKNESEGFQAITELKNENKGDNWFVTEAALVKKENGVSTLLDSFDTGLTTSDDAFRGGLIGMCVGVLGGPIGMLLGGAYGAVVGTTIDAVDAIDSGSIMEQIAGKLEDGMVALVALAGEEAPEGLDAKFTKFDAIVARFDAAVVAQEVEKAREMEAEMDRLARNELRQQRKEENKAKIEEKRAKLDADFEKVKKTLNTDVKDLFNKPATE